MNFRSSTAVIALVALVLGGTGCRRTPNTSPPVNREGEPPVIEVEDDDPAMIKAIDDARATADLFAEHLETPKSGQSYFSVKGAFTDGDNTEHMWLSEASFQDGVFHGRIGNEPNKLTKPKLGDAVSIPKGEISDWMIIEDGELRGGYSIRLLRSRMSPDEQKRFDESAGMTVTNQILPHSR